MANTPVPITARMHFDDIERQYRLVVAKELPKDATPHSINEVIRAVEQFVTLVQLVAFLLDFMSGAGPTSTSMADTAEIGRWSELAEYSARRAGGSYTPGSP